MSELKCQIFTDANGNDESYDELGERMTETVNEWIKENPDIKIQKMEAKPAVGSSDETLHLIMEIWYVLK